MGCVAYFALTANHPFGRPLHRQANIECGHFILSALTGTGKQVLRMLTVCAWHAHMYLHGDHLLNGLQDQGGGASTICACTYT